MRATLAGSAGSSAPGWRLLGTEQNPHPRVHQFPRIMNVAAPRWKHSWILGQRADPHTVCKWSCRRPDLRRWSDSKCVRPLRAHAGSRGPLADAICTSGPDTLLIELHQADEPGAFELGLGAAHGSGIAVGPDQHPGQVVRSGTEQGGEALVAQRLN